MWPRTRYDVMLPPPTIRMPGKPSHARRKGEYEKLDKKGKNTVCKKGKKNEMPKLQEVWA